MEFPKEDKYIEIKQKILEIYNKNYRRKGYRWITSDLHKLGYNINHKTVLRLMQQLDSYIHYFNYQRDSSVLKYRPLIEVRFANMIA